MPSVEELLNQDSEEVEAYADTGIEYCTVDDDTRLVTIPDKYKKLGVESDEKAKRIWFRFPKLVGNNGIDLSAIGVRVNFRNANGEGDIYIVEDLTTDGDFVTFSWELTRKVTAYKGNVSFVVCAVKSATNGTIKNEWNTTLNKECEVLEGLEVIEQIEQENPDIIEYILANLGGSVSAEEIAQAVEAYLAENPPSGMTAEEKAQLQKNTEDISSLSEEIDDLKQNTPSSESALTVAQVEALDDMFKKCAFTSNATTEYEAFKTAFGIEGGGTVEPDEPTEKTLSSISATYTGGDVTVGTALTDLTGITVTATYSDGTTKTVTGYTLSGEILEGENTITVSYGGKTCTFTVTGIEESSEETPTITEFSGKVLPVNPSAWDSDDNWLRATNGSVIGNLINGLDSTDVGGQGWIWRTPLTGTIYVRELIASHGGNKMYTNYLVIAQDEEAINSPSYDNLQSLYRADYISGFTIDGVENQVFVVYDDGTYEQHTSTYADVDNYENGYAMVAITKYEIPDGYVGYVGTTIKTGSSTYRYIDGWNAVAFEDITSNPVAKVKKGGDE